MLEDDNLLDVNHQDEPGAPSLNRRLAGHLVYVPASEPEWLADVEAVRYDSEVDRLQLHCPTAYSFAQRRVMRDVTIPLDDRGWRLLRRATARGAPGHEAPRP